MHWPQRLFVPIHKRPDAVLAVFLGYYPDVAIDRVFVLLDSIARLIGDGNHASKAVVMVVVMFIACAGDVIACKSPVGSKDVRIAVVYLVIGI